MRYVYLAPAHRKIPWLVLALAVLAGLAGCGGDGSGAHGKQGGGKQALPVKVVTVTPQQVDIDSTYPGRVQGKRTVQVTARVEGVLQQRHYTEGQVVHKGDPLYTIDPKPFQATVDQRRAQVASAKAKRNRAQRNWDRVQRLYKANAVSEAKRDQSVSDLETARAAVKQAKANLESAQIDLGYTSIDAPLTGVTSLREVDEGALVNNGTQLTTITQLNPVYVLFALPEDDAIARNKALKDLGGETTDEATRVATILLSNGQPFPVKGMVDFTQSTIDPQTGTVQLRAIVDNPDNNLMPGRFVRVRIRLTTRKNALVVPNHAIASGQQSAQVFVVAKGKVKPVKVNLGPSVAGGRIISKGLSQGAQVIISGLGQIKPGMPVKIKKNRRQKAASAKDAGQTAAAGAAARRAAVDDGMRLSAPASLTAAAGAADKG